MVPLADKIRPKNIEDLLGQKHLLGKGRILNKIVNSGIIPNMIFYGPPGVGKTTVANIIAKNTNKKFYKLNATNASISDIKVIVKDLDSLLTANGVLLYLDEIQNFNKRQQQSLLEYTENGKITLIASTTENPYFYIYNALLSRVNIFEFKPLNKNNIIEGLKRALDILENEMSNNSKIICENKILEFIANCANGDLRKAINGIELAFKTSNKNENGDIIIDESIVQQCMNSSIRYDKFGDSHYDILSAFQKSIRGSDPDAAIHYLARLIKAGDILSICRRLLVIAAEDVGVAYPNAITIVKSCIDSAFQLGLPEARIPLAEAVILLATSPKSNSCIKAIDKALKDLDNKDVGEIPDHLKDGHYKGAKNLGRMVGYKYAHDYKNNYVKQQYMPNNIKDIKYYEPGENKMENAIKNYLLKIKKQ
jgi:putative ATPase